MHNSPEKNKAFQEAWDATNARYIASTKWAISETFKRRHESKAVRKACRENIAFYRKCQKTIEALKRMIHVKNEEAKQPPSWSTDKN